MALSTGCGIHILINGNEPPITSWSVTVDGRQVTTENSLSGGFMLRDVCGGKTATLTLNLDYDAAANPFGVPFNLIVNQKVTNVKAYINSLTGLFWNFPSMVVTGTPMNPSYTATTPNSLTVTLMSDGPFAYPGGITP